MSLTVLLSTAPGATPASRRVGERRLAELQRLYDDAMAVDTTWMTEQRRGMHHRTCDAHLKTLHAARAAFNHRHA